MKASFEHILQNDAAEARALSGYAVHRWLDLVEEIGFNAAWDQERARVDAIRNERVQRRQRLSPMPED